LTAASHHACRHFACDDTPTLGLGGVLRLKRSYLVRACACMLAGVLLCGNALEGARLLQSAQKLGPTAAARTQTLIEVMQSEVGGDEISKLRSMNEFFNRAIVFKDDIDNWGVPDYWTGPIELLNRGQGDCEDYAIAKYFSLIAMGVSPAKMRMVYVRAQVGSSILAHMVLAYYPEPTAEPLILDNLITDMRPASRRPDLAPVFSFNAEGLWQGVGSSTAGDPVARLSKWRDVLSRARAEGWW
jgi:predicted transglutaminase-like cysteine proteinase